jgi:hypothetical protein
LYSLGETKSKIPASAHVISNWINNDAKLSKIDPAYSVNVTEPKKFNSFKLRPRICDWLSHCKDVLLVEKKSVSDPRKREYSFKLDKFVNSAYIKLLFYIEYFQGPHSNGEETVSFDLKLIHFGDPCYKFECLYNGVCSLNPENEAFCQCNGNFTGKNCENQNQCSKIVEKSNKVCTIFCNF